MQFGCTDAAKRDEEPAVAAETPAAIADVRAEQASAASAPLTDNEVAPIVVVLSWDGMRHDFLDLDAFPGLDRVAREGVRAGRLTPVFPSNTFPTHVSMATGTHPDRHGIVDNVFLDQERGRYAYDADANWIEAEPLWIAAQRQGIDTATYFWVGSESDWQGQGTRYRVAPFDSDRPEAEKVDQILEWLALPEGERPRLIMSYWAGADRIGHDEGPNGRGIVPQIRAQDAELVRLLDGIDALQLWPWLSLIVVSDHGMAVATDYLDLHGALAAADIDARILGGAVAQVHLKAPVADERVRRTLDAFLAEVPGSRYFKRDELPAHYRLRRAS
ncbi:MAG: ectonucleotide pyrophosphatase/phosphodiesterase, partial [Pseudomonadota bacterium]